MTKSPAWLQTLRALLDDYRLLRLTSRVASKTHPAADRKPIAFFNATTRLNGLSQNSAFAMFAAMGLQLAGYPVVYFRCLAGMSRCVLGTNRDDHLQLPPCKKCMRQSSKVFSHALSIGFYYQPEQDLLTALSDLSVEKMGSFVWKAPDPDIQSPMPLGEMVLPSLRWALRRHNLQNDEATRYLFREYILSAYNVAGEFSKFLNDVQPLAAVIFNGIMFPEAAARWIAMQKGYRVITHEVGFEPFSAFFSDGQATAYPIQIPQDFDLSSQQNEKLDAYLERRFHGNFTMAGIRFWKDMKDLDDEFLERSAQYKQIVPVFTNVIYDTSQIHANVVFPHMFAWLDLILEIIRAHPETLFVIRAHPDEMRPGTRKQSRESVRGWVEAHNVNDLPNVVFVDSQEYFSSYQLIQHSKFVMVYNSSIGLEATLMGKAVLCGGKARYTQYPIVFFPDTQESYYQKAEEFLEIAEISIPEEFYRNARRFLYYQLYRVSLPFGQFLEAVDRPGFVRIHPLSWDSLKPEYCPAVQAIVNGIQGEQPFLLTE
ncbi:MAG: hypothetical protein WCI88_04195 [Chloroflexota bacterium]